MNYTTIYDFLKSAGKPMTIGEIHSQPDFADYSRRQIANGLQTLTLANMAFRRIHQGKAYYSADSCEGSGMNPCQKRHLTTAYIRHNPEMQEFYTSLQMMDAL